MVTWANADKLASWKKLLSLKGMVSVAEELSCAQAADRIAKYSIPMGGNLTYNYAAKQVNEQILKTFAELAEEQQLVEKYQELLNGEIINTGEKRMVLHQLTRGQLGKDVKDDGVNKREFYLNEVKRISDFAKDVLSGKKKKKKGETMEHWIYKKDNGMYGSAVDADSLINKINGKGM